MKAIGDTIIWGLLGMMPLCTAGQATYVPAFGYDSCIRLFNHEVEVIIDPNAGGRVLRYAIGRDNVIYEDNSQDGWRQSPEAPRVKGHLAGGRFDLGPSRLKPNTDLFFFGAWVSTIVNDFTVRLTSRKDELTGLQMVRTFTLDPAGSRLSCTQTVINRGAASQRVCHWGRTFALGNGICVMPVGERPRFPTGYVMFTHRDSILAAPNDPNIFLDEGLLVIQAPPRHPKLEMNVTEAGWIAYLAPNNLLFIKRFEVAENQPYGEITAANTSIWYNQHQMTEIEPIGPMWLLEPGDEASFTEVWFLQRFSFPAQRKLDRLGLLSAVSSAH